MAKNNKEHRMSERQKYLKTLMAQMGLKSLDELSSEERKRWLRAAEPQEVVQKKLKEMGYSLNKDNNKRSLGRADRISELHKTALNFNLIEGLKKLYNLLSGRDIDEDVSFSDILKSIGKFIKEMGLSKKVVESAINSVGIDLSSISIDDIMGGKDGDDSEEPLLISLLPDGPVKAIATSLASLGLLETSPEGKGEYRDEEIESAFKQFGESLGIFGPITYGLWDTLKSAASEAKSALTYWGDTGDTGDTGDADFLADEDNVIIRGPNVDLDNSSQELKDMVNILEYLCRENEISGLTITSAYRSREDQARVMYDNWVGGGGRLGEKNSKVRGIFEGEYAANINPIIDAFEKNKNKDAAITEAAEKINWTGSHLGGIAIDISGDRGVLDELLEKAKEYIELKKKIWHWNHYHLEVGSIKKLP